MAIAIVAANVRPINPMPGDVINDVAANATITAGALVYHNGTGWALAALSSAAGRAHGVALNGGGSGTKIDVLVRGRVTGWTGLTAGTAIWTAAAGAVAQATATNAARCGFAINTTDIMFECGVTAALE